MKWTQSELNFLNDHYEKFGLEYCAIELNRHKSSVQTKAKRLNLKHKKNLFYLSDNFKNVIKNSNTLSEVCEKLFLVKSYGNRQTVKKYIMINNIDISHFNITKNKLIGKKINLDEILIENSNYTYTRNIKDKLYKEGLKYRICELCGQDENWNGMKISLILDHINGINNDNRIDNLRIICPNCNAGLETFSGKNIKKRTNSNFYTRSDNFDIDRNKKNIRSIGKICVCGNTIKSDSMMCVKCNNISQRKVERPEHSILIKEVSEIGFLATGRKYGVSDNSIRKWIKKG